MGTPSRKKRNGLGDDARFHLPNPFRFFRDGVPINGGRDVRARSGPDWQPALKGGGIRLHSGLLRAGTSALRSWAAAGSRFSHVVSYTKDFWELAGVDGSSSFRVKDQNFSCALPSLDISGSKCQRQKTRNR